MGQTPYLHDIPLDQALAIFHSRLECLGLLKMITFYHPGNEYLRTISVLANQKEFRNAILALPGYRIKDMGRVRVISAA